MIRTSCLWTKTGFWSCWTPGELGQGVGLSITLTLDDTAPEIQTVSKDLTTGALTVTARDNQYLSTVAVLNKKRYPDSGGGPAGANPGWRIGQHSR